MSQQSVELCKVMPLSLKRISINCDLRNKSIFQVCYYFKCKEQGHLHARSTPCVPDYLQFCLPSVWGQKIISTNLELLLLSEQKHESQNVKENLERTKSSHKGDPAGQW